MPGLPTAPAFRLAPTHPPGASSGGANQRSSPTLEGAPRRTPRSLSWALLLLIGCGAPMGVRSPVGELDSIDLAPAPGWPTAIAARSVPASFRTTITALDADPDGKVWLLRDETSSPSQLDGVPVLERYAPSGHLEQRFVFPERSKVSSFVVHPSGELSVFVMRDDDGDMQFDLEILRLSPNGDALATAKLEEIPGPRENLFYDASGVHELPIDGPFKLGSRSHVVGVADGEGLYLLAEWTYGFKLYRLDPTGRRLWGTQVMPANVGTAFQFSPSLVARDEGAVYVATQIFEDDVPIYGQHFGRAPLTPLGSYDALVQKFDTAGTFGGGRLFGGPAVDHPSAITVKDGVVFIAGAARITKHDAPNRTMEWDVAVMRGRVDENSTLEYRTLDLSRDDFGWALAPMPDGRIIVGGRTDYVQVDTNSEVENGKGLLLTLEPDLSRGSLLELPLPRDVQVRALHLLPSGDVVLAGTRDGPLTHTPVSETHNDGFWGVAHLGAGEGH